MKSLLYTPLVIAIGLGVAAIVVFGLGDKKTFISPPEVVAASFVHSLVTGRFDQAYECVGDEARTKIRRERLPGLRAQLLRMAGQVEDVMAEPGRIRGNGATARVTVKGNRNREVQLEFRLTLDLGQWSIVELSEIEDLPARTARRIALPAAECKAAALSG